jgi:hypothetical protein
MSGRMRWDRLRYLGKPTLNIKDDFELEDRAKHWPAAVKRRRQEQRNKRRNNVGEVTGNSTKVPYTDDVPW